MANVSRPHGLKATRYINGAAWNGEAELHYCHASDASNIYVNDLVQLDTTNRGSPATAAFVGLPAIKQYAAAQANTRGVVVGFLPTPELNQTATASLMQKYRIASTERYAFVVVDNKVLFSIEENASNTKSVADIGKNHEVLVVAGDATIGISKTTLSNSASATTATLPLRLYRYTQGIANSIGASAKWEVLLNTQDFSNTTGL